MLEAPMTMTWTDWIPRERYDCQLKPEDLPRFYGRVWFPERTPQDGPPQPQPGTEPKEKGSDPST